MVCIAAILQRGIALVSNEKRVYALSFDKHLIKFRERPRATL
jgi:hypothetical protein